MNENGMRKKVKTHTHTYRKGREEKKSFLLLMLLQQQLTQCRATGDGNDDEVFFFTQSHIHTAKQFVRNKQRQTSNRKVKETLTRIDWEKENIVFCVLFVHMNVLRGI